MTDTLVGVWDLVSFEDVDDEGGRHEGPLGPAPVGLLFYGADGHVSVSIMRTGDAAAAHGPSQQYMSYAGRWRRDGDRVAHTITVAPDPAWIGSEQVRDVELSGDDLALSGRGPSGDPRRRVLHWRRVESRPRRHTQPAQRVGTAV